MRGIWLRFKYADWQLGWRLVLRFSPSRHLSCTPHQRRENSQPVLAAQVATHSVTLTWTASPNVSGYNVYRSAARGTGYAKLNAAMIAGLSYVDSTVNAGATYYYVAIAVHPTPEPRKQDIPTR